jgi:hypothetical protein
VKTLTPVALVLLVSCATVTLAQETAAEDYHPTDAQVRQLQHSCSVSDAGMQELQGRVISAVADWRKATTSEGPLAAMRELDGYFEQLRNHGGLSGKKSIYVLCVEKSVRQFVELQREKPQALAASGNSEPLLRSAFASEDEIWRRGCAQAESDAVAKLRQRCGDRTFVETSSDCPQGAGNIRTYTNQVSGECRAK